MSLYLALRELGDLFAQFRNSFITAANAISSVWLIGEHITPRLLVFATLCAAISARFYGAATNWQYIYSQLTGAIGGNGPLSTLLSFVDDLAAFMRDPDGWISDAIKSRWPNIMRFLNDPVGEMIEVIVTRTGFDYDFVYNPFTRIRAIVSDTLGILQAIRNDPDGWLIGRISALYPAVVAFLRDPDGWLIGKITSRFPVLAELIRDPDTFITNRFIAFLDRQWDRHKDAIIRIAEKIINAIM